MNILYLDFESAFGTSPTWRDVTLSKMTTEEYVRDPEFHPYMAGFALNDGDPRYIYGVENLRSAFAKLPWSHLAVCCHHAHFDIAVLSWFYGYKPKFIFDTLSMARALLPYESASLSNLGKVLGVGEKGVELHQVRNKWDLDAHDQHMIGGYCATNQDSDVNLTRRIFKALAPKLPKSEFAVIDLTVRMFTEPLLQVDPTPLVEDYRRELKKKRALLKRIGAEKSDLMSNDKLAPMLLTLGVDPPKKLSPAKVKSGKTDRDSAGDAPTGILPSFKQQAGMTPEQRVALNAAKELYPWAYAFGKSDEQFKLLLDHPNPEVAMLVEARMGVKSTIKETRSKRFYKIGQRGAFPVYLNYAGAGTWRWSGGDKQNAQNMNRIDERDPTTGALRKSWVAPPGHVIVVRDLGQIEARMLAYWAGQDDIVEVFRNDQDVYCHTASPIYGREITKKTSRNGP